MLRLCEFPGSAAQRFLIVKEKPRTEQEPEATLSVPKECEAFF